MTHVPIPRFRRSLASLVPLLLVASVAHAAEPIDGLGNNQKHPAWGAAGTNLLRLSPPAYADGISSPSGVNRPSARAISDAICDQTTDLTNNRHLADMVYLFGQFLDHDIDLTETADDAFNIPVPTGDPFFDPTSTGTEVIDFTRSIYDVDTGTSTANPRQQVNSITSYIDGSQIYGSDETRQTALRTFRGGHLRTSAGDMLPFNTQGLQNANDAGIVPDNELFLAGDIRANENIELTAMQTLFMREHNRLADDFATKNPKWSDERIFQAARQVVIAELQSITFNEFLPALLGPAAPPRYSGYDPRVDSSIATEFSAVAFRFGHSMLDGDIARLNNDGTIIPEGDAQLAAAFFNPTLFNPSLPNHEGDIDPILKGAATGNAQEIDTKIVDDVRNFLFGQPGQGGFDLASLNIQRGRDHGIADYNTLRIAYGLPRITKFSQITSDTSLQSALQTTYGSVNNIDPWIGGLAETHVPGGSLGPLFATIIADQFHRIRAGDRFWFEHTLSGKQLDEIEHTTLADIILRNTALTNLQANVFFYNPDGVNPPAAPPPPQSQPVGRNGPTGPRSGGQPEPRRRPAPR